MRFLNKKWLVLYFTSLFVLTTLFYSTFLVTHQSKRLDDWIEDDPSNWRHLMNYERDCLSELGRKMFVEETITNNYQTPNETLSSRKYKILIWKYGSVIKNRFIKHYSSIIHDPFANCSVSNCDLLYEDGDLKSADAVYFHMHRMKEPHDLPPPSERQSNQRWVFVTDESPYNIFLHRNKMNILKNYNGLFNWTMNYRMDADVPVPYGRTLRLNQDEMKSIEIDENYAGKKSKLAAIMGSNCGGQNHRWKFVKELQEFMRIDTYGHCGKLKCPGHYETDCSILVDYKFYLAFENSNCREYLTEKVWWNAYHKDVIPVIMGASRSDCARLLPPDSYIHTEDFKSPEDLAKYLIYLDSEDGKYNKYFAWKRQFKVINEHGYFQSDVYHFCRLCEALNYNSQVEKVLENLEDIQSVSKDCFMPSWKLKST